MGAQTGRFAGTDKTSIADQAALRMPLAEMIRLAKLAERNLVVDAGKGRAIQGGPTTEHTRLTRRRHRAAEIDPQLRRPLPRTPPDCAPLG